MDWRSHIARYGPTWFPGEPWTRWTFLLLFALGAALRLWNLPGLPYTHDELSALMRIYPTLAETIQRGVIELDTHPPGVQVFEWAWTSAFGMSEAVVKLPFIVLALVAIFLFHRAALLWTSPGTALVTTALLCTLQYTVLYAQIARPYAVGFFTIALLADRITQLLAFQTRSALVGVGVAAVLCAYVHHFSLLLAGIMVASVYPLLLPGQRKPYLIMCGATALVYVPNIPIFLKQLGHGGLGNWLPPPDAGWTSEFVHWIHHFSAPFMFATALVVLGSTVLALRCGSLGPSRWLLPLWGLSPLVIGYVYSVWRAPVLQYSMVLFGFPFILAAAFAGLRHAPRWAVILCCSTLSILASYTLIVERKHHRIFSDSPYAAMVRVARSTVLAHPNERTLVIFDAPVPQVDFHVRRHRLDTLVKPIWPRLEKSRLTLEEALRDPQWQQVVLGTSNGCAPERVAQVRSYFPFLQAMEDHVEGQVHVFSRLPGVTRIADRSGLMELTPGKRAGEVDVHADLDMVHDPKRRRSAWDLDGHEFGIALTAYPEFGSFDPQDQFEATMEFAGTPTGTDLLLVLELRNARNEILQYAAVKAVPSMAPALVSAAVSPSWAGMGNGPFTVHAYVHDRSKGPALVHGITLYRRDHNPVVNALLRPVKDLGHLPHQ